MAHIVAIDQINVRIFPGAYDKVRIRPGLVGQDHAPPAPRSMSSAAIVDCVSGVK